jgi:hypothetical protein
MFRTVVRFIERTFDGIQRDPHKHWLRLTLAGPPRVEERAPACRGKGNPVPRMTRNIVTALTEAAYMPATANAHEIWVFRDFARPPARAALAGHAANPEVRHAGHN